MFSFNKDTKQGPERKDTTDNAKLNSNYRVYIPLAIDNFGNYISETSEITLEVILVMKN